MKEITTKRERRYISTITTNTTVNGVHKLNILTGVIRGSFEQKHITYVLNKLKPETTYHTNVYLVKNKAYWNKGADPLIDITVPHDLYLNADTDKRYLYRFIKERLEFYLKNSGKGYEKKVLFCMKSTTSK